MDNMTNVLLSTLCALAAVGGGVASIWFAVRLYRNQYAGGHNKRLRDAALAACLLGIGIGFAVFAVASYVFGLAVIPLLPFALCLGIAVTPFGVMGAYWRAYQIDGLFPVFPNGPVSARPASLEQGQDPSLPRVTDQQVLAGMGIVFSTMAAAAVMYLVVVPNTQGITWVAVPLLALIAMVGYFGSIVLIWHIRRGKSGL